MFFNWLRLSTPGPGAFVLFLSLKYLLFTYRQIPVRLAILLSSIHELLHSLSEISFKKELEFFSHCTHC